MAASKFTMKYALSGREYCNSYFSVFHRYVIENGLSQHSESQKIVSFIRPGKNL